MWGNVQQCTNQKKTFRNHIFVLKSFCTKTQTHFYWIIFVHVLADFVKQKKSRCKGTFNNVHIQKKTFRKHIVVIKSILYKNTNSLLLIIFVHVLADFVKQKKSSFFERFVIKKKNLSERTNSLLQNCNYCRMRWILSTKKKKENKWFFLLFKKCNNKNILVSVIVKFKKYISSKTICDLFKRILS